VPNPDAPVSYPDNFPGEFSYQLAGAQLTVGGADVEIGMDLEGAWANEEVKEGDQIVFGRVRIRAKDIADGRYRVTHPYGQDQFVADGEGINFTQDIGVNGGFGQALTSRVGPFLQWDPAVAPAAPAGYVGDPGIDHKVIGSPYGTNYVAVEQFDEATQSWSEVGRTDVFSIQGRKATNAGLNVDKATYTVGADGKGTADVYASSDAGQLAAGQEHRSRLPADDHARVEGQVLRPPAADGGAGRQVRRGDRRQRHARGDEDREARRPRQGN
jgi:hypothetical protein